MARKRQQKGTLWLEMSSAEDHNTERSLGHSPKPRIPGSHDPKGWDGMGWDGRWQMVRRDRLARKKIAIEE